ncbi:hypothetical protein ACFQ0B_24495 [Nonomuraea thailandensis]
MTMNTVSSSPGVRLKWLLTPRAAWKVMAETSGTTKPATITVPSHHIVRRQRSTWPISQASVIAYSAKDTENLNGLSQTASPSTVRSSTRSPTPLTIASATIAAVQKSSGRCAIFRVFFMGSSLLTCGFTDQRRDHRWEVISSLIRQICMKQAISIVAVGSCLGRS